MAEEITIRIECADSQDIEKSHWLEELQGELQQELGVSCQAETEKAPEGTMGVGITTAITLANFALSAIGMLLTILEHRRKTSNRTSLTVKGDNYTYTITDLADEERDKILQDLKNKNLKNVTLQVND